MFLWPRQKGADSHQAWRDGIVYLHFTCVQGTGFQETAALGNRIHLFFFVQAEQKGALDQRIARVLGNLDKVVKDPTRGGT